MPTSATRVGPKYQVTIPKKVRDAVGLKVGDLVEATVGRNGIVLRPKVQILIDKDPVVEKALAEALADVKAGRVSKPHKSARAFVRDALQRGRELSKNRPVR
jgi:AbrB family looped-hinge helix DNA binding protein